MPGSDTETKVKVGQILVRVEQLQKATDDQAEQLGAASGAMQDFALASQQLGSDLKALTLRADALEKWREEIGGQEGAVTRVAPLRQDVDTLLAWKKEQEAQAKALRTQRYVLYGTVITVLGTIAVALINMYG